MSIDKQLTKRIMRQVYLLHVLKRILSPLMVKGYILIGLLWQGIATVSIVNVLSNVSAGTNSLESNIAFFKNAFVNTDIAIQIGIIVGFAIVLWMVYDIAKNLRDSRSLSQSKFSY